MGIYLTPLTPLLSCSASQSVSGGDPEEAGGGREEGEARRDRPDARVCFPGDRPGHFSAETPTDGLHVRRPHHAG